MRPGRQRLPVGDNVWTTEPQKITIDEKQSQVFHRERGNCSCFTFFDNKKRKSSGFHNFLLVSNSAENSIAVLFPGIAWSRWNIIATKQFLEISKKGTWNYLRNENVNIPMKNTKLPNVNVFYVLIAMLCFGCCIIYRRINASGGQSPVLRWRLFCVIYTAPEAKHSDKDGSFGYGSISWKKFPVLFCL